MRFVALVAPHARPAAQRHARSARPLRRDRHHRRAARPGRRRDHRAPGAQSRRRAHRRAGRRHHGRRSRYYGVAPELRRAVPQRRGALRRSDVASRRCRPTPSCIGAARRRPTPRTALRHRRRSSTSVVLRAEGPHNAQNAAGAAALALTFGLTPPTIAAGPGRVDARVRPRAGLHGGRAPGGAAAGEEPGRVPAEPAHPRHRATPDGDRDRDQRRLRRRPRRLVAVGRRLRRARAGTPARLVDRRARAPPTWRCGCTTTTSHVDDDRARPGEGACATRSPPRVRGDEVIVF